MTDGRNISQTVLLLKQQQTLIRISEQHPKQMNQSNCMGEKMSSPIWQVSFKTWLAPKHKSGMHKFLYR